MHRTIFLFVRTEGSIMRMKMKKLYKPFSYSEKVIWRVDFNKDNLKSNMREFSILIIIWMNK